MPSFYTLPTALGEAKIANAIALGTQVNISELAVGDGGGSLPTPDSDRTALVNELRRAPINRIEVDDENPNWIVVEQILPPDVGGWTVRELGLLDDDGNLIAYGNYPETYKPVLSEGSGRTQTIRFVMQVSDTAAVTLKVDPSVVLASRQYVDDADQAHAESRNHPAATESAQGMIQRATSAQGLAGSDNSRAMTPARVHEAFNQYGLGSAYLDGQRIANLDAVSKTSIFWTGASPTGGPGPSSYFGIHGQLKSDFAVQMALRERMFSFRSLESGLWGDWFYVFHTGNMGADSGLDGDLLDGQHGAFYRDAGNLNAGKVPVARLPEATELAIGAAEIATQQEVNTGADDARFVTPKKLKDWVKQATESVLGLIKIATQAQTDAGTDDATAVTPKKLRWGVSYSLNQDGYLALPSWLGGIVFQWGQQDGINASGSTYSLPITFPNAGFSGVASHVAGGTIANAEITVTRTSITLRADTSGNTINWFAIGH